MGVPTCDQLPRIDVDGFAYEDDRPIWQLVALAFPPSRIGDGNFAGTGDRHEFPGVARDRLQVVQANGPAVLRLNVVARRRARRRTADVESTHRQLRAGLADRLGRNDAHRLADVDFVTSRQVPSVALGAHAVARLASDRRTHMEFIDAQRLKTIHPRFVHHYAGRQE